MNEQLKKSLDLDRHLKKEPEVKKKVTKKEKKNGEEIPSVQS